MKPGTDNYISPELRWVMQSNPNSEMLDLEQIEQIRLHCDIICSRMKRKQTENETRPCQRCILYISEYQDCIRVKIANRYHGLIKQITKTLKQPEGQQ